MAKPIEPQYIREDLKNGLTISEVCTKYELTFQQLVDNLKYYDNPIHRTKKPKSWLNIDRTDKGKFRLIKSNVWYGQFHTLHDAQLVRDWFIRNGWSKKNIDRACRECGVERCKR